MIRRILLVFFSVLLLTVACLFGVLYAAFLGPSPSVRDQLTLSMLETSALKFVPALFVTARVVDEIVENNGVVETFSITDTSLVTVTTYKPSNTAAGGGGGETPADEVTDDEWADYPDGIRIETVRGSTYRGYVMLIRDPSRVYTATSSDFKSGAPGLRINDALNKEGAVAAINGGGFPDPNGAGDGDLPIGMVFSKGELLWGGENTVYSGVMAFDKNDVLIVGSMSPRQARELGVRDAICFGPVLVVNGEPAEVRGASSGLNPRSAIGQRQDGTVLLLCIDGRMPSSMGASYKDLIDIMVDYGAVNAANLDGGTSSLMMYNGENVNIGSSLYGPRRMPTFFMVKPEAQDGE